MSPSKGKEQQLSGNRLLVRFCWKKADRITRCRHRIEDLSCTEEMIMTAHQEDCKPGC